MLKWNQYCDATRREGDCILLSEERTFDEADVLNDILNREDLKEKKGSWFLYIGMMESTGE